MRLKANAIFLILTFAMIIYIIARAVCLDITNDEAYSFYNVKHFWYAEALCTGNTHWLNFLSIKCAVLLGLENNWQIRWFSLLSGIVFLSIAFTWIRSLKETYLKVFAFSLACLNPFVLDYLSLARGYSSGLAFEALTLLFFIISIDKNNRKYAFAALICSGLSAISNFSFVYFFAAFSLIYFFKFYVSKGISVLKSGSFYIDTVFIALISFLIVRALIYMTKCSNDVIGAGGSFTEMFFVFTDGFLNDKLTVRSGFLPNISIGIFVFMIGSCVYGILKRKKHNDLLFFYSSLILSIILMIMVINNLFFNVVYPSYRSALLFFPLTIVNTINFFDCAVKNALTKNLTTYFLSIGLLAVFIMRINFTHTFDFWEQSDSSKCFDLVENLGAKKVGVCPELYGVYRNYYQMTEKHKYNFKGERINTNAPKGISDEKNKINEFEYLLLFPPYDLSFYRNNFAKTEGVRLFPQSGVLIVRIKK